MNVLLLQRVFGSQRVYLRVVKLMTKEVEPDFVGAKVAQRVVMLTQCDQMLELKVAQFSQKLAQN